MASIMFARECPQCGRSAIEDNYYKTDETYIICYRCGYYYSKRIEKRTDVFCKIKVQKNAKKNTQACQPSI